MTIEIEIDRPYDEAERLVKTAMANTDGITDVTIEEDTVIGRTRGGLTSPGETVNVYFPDDDPSQTETTISVWAEGKGGSTTSDPWKYRNEFMEELEALRNRPLSELPPGPDNLRSDAESEFDRGEEESRNKNAVVWMTAAKYLAYVLVVMLLIMGVVAAIALL